MRNRSSQFALFIVVASLTAGCGGGGGVASTAPTLELTSSAQAVDYGQTVSVSWTTTNVAALSTTQTSFPVGSTQTSGSLVDTPSSSTTYTVTAVGLDGSEISKSVSVTVNPSTKKILLLADQSVAGVPQVTSEIQALTSLPVTTSLTMPTIISADLLIIGSSSAVTPSDQAIVTAYLAAGGRVVIIGGAAQKLANGTTTDSDISSIGSWLAGGTSSSFSINQGTVVSTRPVGVPLNASLLGRDTAGGNTISPVAADAIGLTTDKGLAFVYWPPIGGRVAYVSSAPQGSDATSFASRLLFLAACRWALEIVT